MAFDAPSREVACERRPRSNTPVQSLVTLNDPAFVAAANGLSRQIVAQGGDTFASRLDYAMLRTLARLASNEEKAAFGKLYETSLRKFEGDPGSAEKLVTVGLAKPQTGSLPELAAWTVLANVLLNLDEALTKG